MLKADTTKRKNIRLITLKLTPKEKRELLAKAKKYADGNLSLWLRYAGSRHKPTKSDLAN